jgi:5-methylcytosine-specific restriction enzyme subunit McrC
MPTQVRLQEWGDRQEIELPFEQLVALRQVAGNALDIVPGSRRDAWSIRANSYCGTIRVGDLSILIRPKVPLENLFYMLTAGQTDLKFGATTVGYEQDELMPALAAFYERLMAETLQRGVLKAYRQYDERLVALRGRIDIPAVIRGGGIPSPIPCRFDELSIDIPENQILWAAANLLTTYPEVAPDVRRKLRRTSGILDGVSPLDARQLPAIHLTRLNRYYEPALRIAGVILRSGGVRDREGGLQASTFLMDMNLLFEQFVTGQLKRGLAGHLEVRDQVLSYLDIGGHVRMYPDLIFYRRGSPVSVADIKYKLTDDGLGRNSDYYQLLAYATTLQVRTGLLIYGGRPSEPSTVDVAGSDCHLALSSIDLTSNSSTVEALADLSKWIVANSANRLSSMTSTALR